MQSLSHRTETKTITDLVNLYEDDLLNLEPGFQRQSVWSERDRAKLIEVFVRINSTGKALTPQEKRRAKYYNSTFLKEADRLARRLEHKFTRMRILSASQISRMKHIEVVCELMVSIHRGDVINKKAALDRVMKADDFSVRDTAKAARATHQAVNRVMRMFPRLGATRFSKVSDFYSLVMVVAKFEEEGFILTDRRRNRLAWDLLVAFSNKVDELRERQRKLQSVKPEEELYRGYLQTVLQATDEYGQRKAREAILKGLLGGLFAKKDSQRGFTSEQRRLLWNTTNTRKCTSCGEMLSWDNFTLDHIDPYSKGGRSRIENAALMCRSCNSSKGNRRKRVA